MNENVYTYFEDSDGFFDARKKDVENNTRAHVPVNVSLSTEKRTGSHGLGASTLILTLGYAAMDGIYLLRQTLGQWSTHAGRFVDPRELDEALDMRDEAEKVVKEYLDEKDVPWRKGQIAVPEGHTVLEGNVNFLKLVTDEPGNRIWVRRED